MGRPSGCHIACWKVDDTNSAVDLELFIKIGFSVRTARDPVENASVRNDSEVRVRARERERAALTKMVVIEKAAASGIYRDQSQSGYRNT